MVHCLQAAGISGTQTPCQTVMADITTSAERGEYIGFVALSAVLGPSLSPLIEPWMVEHFLVPDSMWQCVPRLDISVLPRGLSPNRG